MEVSDERDLLVGMDYELSKEEEWERVFCFVCWVQFCLFGIFETGFPCIVNSREFSGFLSVDQADLELTEIHLCHPPLPLPSLFVGLVFCLRSGLL